MKPTTLTSTLILLSLIGCSAKNNAPVDSIDLQQEIEESTDELADAGEGGRLVQKSEKKAKAEEGEPSLLTEFIGQEVMATTTPLTLDAVEGEIRTSTCKSTEILRNCSCPCVSRLF